MVDTNVYRKFSMSYLQMLSFLFDIYKNQYNIIQLIHMYKQLYTIKNMPLAGGGYTIMFYAIEFYMFICGLFLLCVILFYTLILSYVYMNKCSQTHVIILCTIVFIVVLI